jgi:hypothetical protein
MSPTALGALLNAASKTLVWLDVVDAFFFQDRNNEILDHSSWLGPLGRCGQLRTAILPKVDAAALGMLASPVSKLEYLSVAPHMPLSAMEPFVQAGLNNLDLSGFFLDANASDLTITCVTSLIVGDDVKGNHSRQVKGVFPRAKLLKCTKLVDLELRCGLSEEDVSTCLIHLPNLRALNLSDGEYDPSTIGALGKLGQLRCLILSGCLQNYYDQGNEIGAKNVEALLVMGEGLKELVQLDLSHHYDSFYATVEDEDEHCPYDLIGMAVGKMSKLQLLNLTENGHKFGWSQLRHAIRSALGARKNAVTILYD